MPPSPPRASCHREIVEKNSATPQAARQTKQAEAHQSYGQTCLRLTTAKACLRMVSLSSCDGKSLRDGFRRALKAIYLFRIHQKKEPPDEAAQVTTGRRQTEWTGATRCPQNGQST